VVAIKSFVAAALLALLLAPAALSGSSKRGDNPTVRIDPSDQAWATQSLLRSSDLGFGWHGGPTKPTKLAGPACPGFDPKVSDLVVTGHANAIFQNPRAGGQVALDTQVLQSAANVRTDFARTIQPELADCLAYQLKRSGPGIVGVKVERIDFPTIGALNAAYRGTITVKTRNSTAKVISDFVFIGDGRSEYSLNVVAPARYLKVLVGFEADMARIFVKRGARTE